MSSFLSLLLLFIFLVEAERPIGAPSLLHFKVGAHGAIGVIVAAEEVEFVDLLNMLIAFICLKHFSVSAFYSDLAPFGVWFGGLLIFSLLFIIIRR